MKLKKKTYILHAEYKKILADTLTPVSIYLKIRDQFPHSLLLESSDYDLHTNNFSYICCNPIASISIQNGMVDYRFPDGTNEILELSSADSVPELIEDFSRQFKSESYPFKFITNGLFGYIAHDAVKHFESIDLNEEKESLDIPEIYYAVYQNIIAISIFNHEAHLFSHSFDKGHNLKKIEQLLRGDNIATYGCLLYTSDAADE